MIAKAKYSPSGSCAAVSHSTFLRMLLAVTLHHTSLLQVATMQQANCCINVLDVRRDNDSSPTPSYRHVYDDVDNHPTSGVLVNWPTRATTQTEAEDPYAVVRINEKRHLTGLL